MEKVKGNNMDNNGLKLTTVIDCNNIDEIYFILSKTYYVTMGVLEYGRQCKGCYLKRILDNVWCYFIVKEEYKDILSILER